MNPKILLGGLCHETHTFVEQLTTLRDFRDGAVRHGHELIEKNEGSESPMDGFLEYAATQRWSIIPSVQMSARPSGTVEDEVYLYFRKYFFQDLARHLPSLDGIYLVLHGAMVCQSYPDVEGQLLEEINDLLTKADISIPVVALLDLHANVSARMADASSCLLSYRKNPHTDARDAAIEAAKQLRSLLESDECTQLYLPCPFILPPSGTGTGSDPLKSVQIRAREIEEQDKELLCINVLGGYAYADISDCGPSLTACTRGDKARAENYLQELLTLLTSNLSLGYPREYALNDALQLADAGEDKAGPILLVEPSDNIGGGSSGDGTGVLEPLLRTGRKGIMAILNDPEAVRICRAAGLDRDVSIEIGGKLDRFHGNTVAFSGRIVLLSSGEFDLENKNSHLASVLGTHIEMGPCAVIQNEQASILLTTMRTAPMDLGQLHSQGLHPEQAAYVVVKAAISHKQAYDPIASQSYYIDSPGLCTSDLARLPYRHAKRRRTPGP